MRLPNLNLVLWLTTLPLACSTACGDFLEDDFADDCSHTLTCAAPDAGGAAGEASGGTGGSTSSGGASPTSSTGHDATSSAGGHGGTATSAGGTALTSSDGTGGTGGTSGSGGTSGTGGTGDPPCDDACDGDTPVCDEPTDTCVTCLDDNDCDDGVCDTDARTCVECVDSDDCNDGVCDTGAHTCVECLAESDCDDPTPHCDTEQQFCVECLQPSDCSDPQASLCDAGSCSPCTTNADCEHLTGTTVCDASAGECVECTGADYAGCGELDGTPLVCDSLTRTCSDQKQASAGPCNPCLSDAECKPGQRCAREVFEGTELGYRCFWERGAPVGGAPENCPSKPPHVATKVDATSIDGVTAYLCTLAISTCKAHEDFGNLDCEATENVPDPSLCGEPELDDAGCELYGLPEDNIYRCTVRCSGNDDCKEDHECDTSASPNVCFLNP